MRVRRDINQLLDVIRIVTWLNQHNREFDEEGHILATEEDFLLAAELVADSLQRAWKSLTPAEQAVMEAIASLSEPLRNNGFTRNDLEVEGHDKRRLQDALKALTDTGYLERDGKRGPRGYRYTVSRTTESSVLGVYLRPAGNDGKEGPEETDDVAQGLPARGCDNDEDEEEGGEERGSRDIARNDIRAIESGTLQEEGAIARSREEDNEDDFEGDKLADDEDYIDYLSRLTELGWYRAPSAFSAEEVPENYSVDRDPVARRLRHHTPIYYGPTARFTVVGLVGDSQHARSSL